MRNTLNLRVKAIEKNLFGDVKKIEKIKRLIELNRADLITGKDGAFLNLYYPEIIDNLKNKFLKQAKENS